MREEKKKILKHLFRQTDEDSATCSQARRGSKQTGDVHVYVQTIGKHAMALLNVEAAIRLAMDTSDVHIDIFINR